MLFLKQYEVIIDVLNPVKQPIHVISQADVNSNEFVFIFKQDKMAYFILENDVMVYIRKPDGVVVEKAIGAFADRCSLLIERGMNNIEGSYQLELVVSNGDKLVLACEIVYNVKPSIQVQETLPPEETVPLWQQVSAKVDLALSEVRAKYKEIENVTATEKDRVQAEKDRTDRFNVIEDRFDNLIADSGQPNKEVVDSRGGQPLLKNRLDLMESKTDTNTTSLDKAKTDITKNSTEIVRVEGKTDTNKTSIEVLAQEVARLTSGGVPKLQSYPYVLSATTNNQTVFTIPLSTFDNTTDTTLVMQNRTTLNNTDYTISGRNITLVEGVTVGTEIAIMVLKNVPVGVDGSINGNVLAVNSMDWNRLKGTQPKQTYTPTLINGASLLAWSNGFTKIGNVVHVNLVLSRPNSNWIVLDNIPLQFRPSNQHQFNIGVYNGIGGESINRNDTGRIVSSGTLTVDSNYITKANEYFIINFTYII